MVNNSSYLNYIEHARHEFLKNHNVDFAKLAQEGIYLIVIRIELDFLYSLRSGDKFYVTTNLERISRLRFGFRQEIFRFPDDRAVLKAKVIGTAVGEKGKPILPREIEEMLIERG
jgi:acyl-CoA thioester hydrolase